jgi:hypothetical protein
MKGPMRGAARLAFIGAVFCGLALNACNRGPAEQAGKNVDDAVDNLTKGHEEPLKKEGGQKAGEQIDKATGNDK